MREKSRAPRDPARRRFTKAVAAALAAAPLVATALNQPTRAQTPPTNREPAAPPNPQPTPTPQPPSPVAEAYGEVARVRFGERLTADELARVKRSVARKVRRGDDLRDSKIKLQNGDEPDFVFSA